MKKSNTWLYFLLLLTSLLAFCFSFCFEVNDRFFTILSSVGCSGIVSVIVAYLIERANERIQKNHDKQIVELLLEGFDIRVSSEMQRALLRCARQNSFEISRSYDIMEIKSMLETFVCDDTYFIGFSDDMSKCIQDFMPLSLLAFEKSTDGMNLYSYLKQLNEYINMMQEFEGRPESSELLKFLCLESLNTLANIYDVRKLKPRFELQVDTKNYIMSFRAAVERRRESSDV